MKLNTHWELPVYPVLKDQVMENVWKHLKEQNPNILDCKKIEHQYIPIVRLKKGECPNNIH